jgi:bifunctional oligoribonuclease and PAP phosphatase NrnA
MWFDVIELIRRHRRFLASSHEHPDGDAIGAMLGLGLLLEELGKDALLVLDDPVPRIYRFLDPDARIRCYEPSRDDPALAACDAAFVLDVGSLDRVGKVGAALARHRVPTVCIDHHATNDTFADVNVVVRDAASTASLIFDLLRALGRQPSPAIADALLTGLATDTGWFRFPNTSPQALRDAAALREAGADPARIYARVYEDLSAARMRLLGLAMADLREEAGGRLVYFVVTRPMFAETGAEDSEVEGFVDSFRKIGGVEIIVFFREQPDGRTRVSLRAKGDLDVGTLAAQLGGGGHRAAAGAVLDEPLAAAMPRVLAAARCLLGL